ncbi:DUF4097 family beta strand repeat-containing protein [Alteromonas sp. ASW11-36]|uniref:DUF4097 family beta strand repeat-containing protein n=1 Tax=Alteromonas arenosi TaxID=3055817 RepID=A0ABT7SSB0_9ALTE|nr:DUF4097 family beta strand repeat-containing protein [Alteromonas sp. ASW11-36]MDM7859072.1 DUF4097 family beta strand repeat-containing protein [Alteromonas sp. ASW11-36]
MKQLTQHQQSKGVCLCATMLTGIMLFTTPVLAGQKVDQTLDVDAQSRIEIEHLNGSAVVKGWDREEVRVEGELSDRASEFIFERRGRNVQIKVEMESSSYKGDWKKWGYGHGDDLTIYVPIGSEVNYTSVNASFDGESLHGGLDVEVVNGEVSVNDIEGRIRLESVNGSINARNLSGDVKIETVNGSIEGRHSGEGDIKFESVNGDIRISSDSREIHVETVNGDLELELQAVDELDLTSVNGSIEVSMNLQPGGDVRVSTVGGSVELIFQEGVSAHFDIEGHAGGKFVNRLTDDKTQKAKYGPRRWLEFSTGNGAAEVEVSTVNGRVELRYQ